jgi:hypothetical protein
MGWSHEESSQLLYRYYSQYELALRGQILHHTIGEKFSRSFVNSGGQLTSI